MSFDIVVGLAMMGFSAMSVKMPRFPYVEVCYMRATLLDPSPWGFYTPCVMRPRQARSLPPDHLLRMELVDVLYTGLDADRSVSVPWIAERTPTTYTQPDPACKYVSHSVDLDCRTSLPARTRRRYMSLRVRSSFVTSGLPRRTAHTKRYTTKSQPSPTRKPE